MPTFPLIPEYVVDTDGNISGSAEVCGIDPDLDEILLDFSAMSPLPQGMQRAGESASGPADLLGIAPGAQYRLVVPGGAASVSALVAAFVAAGAQTPAPNVITASIGWGTDAFGFSSRYLEEDPLLRSTISTLVNAQNIVVCISAGDGLRKFTNAAVNPMGGSVPTNLTKSSDQVTDLNDVSNSTTPSAVLDTGAIDVGGSTTDDIYAGGNLADQNNPFANQLAFPEVRWNGAQGFSSGFGSRVNISAPSDNIPALILSSSVGNNYDSTALSLNGGTSASAPMVAAAAAVMLQVARLSGHPFAKATDVRDLLVSTAVPIPNVQQADMNINVGPQLNLRRAVETVLANAGTAVPPGAPRVAIAQRQLFQGLDFNCQFQSDDDHDFVEATDPAYIRLDDREGCGLQENRNLNSPITIAPDWEGIPRGAHYRLYVAGHPQSVLSQGPWARLWPKQIFNAAGLAAASSSVRTVTLSYDVFQGFHLVASTTFDLTFGPTPATSVSLPAPVVAPVITGATMSVSYDFSGAAPGDVSSPVIEVSSPSRPSPDSGPFYAAIYKSPVLMSPKGTIQIPVSALGGAGVYGVAVNLSPNPDPLLAFFRVQNYSSFAFTRIQAGNTSARPAAPLLAAANSTASADPPSHTLTIAHGGSFTVSYDVRNVPGANNAALEISSSGPNLMNNANPFNNPNGSVPDDNGVDTGSVAVIPLPSTSGSITLTDQQAHLVEGMSQVVRVLPRAGTQGIGEAGDVSTISEPGIMSPDGDDLSNGFAINTSGDDGVFTSQGGPFGSLIGVFSQSTGQVPGLIVQPAPQPFALIGGYVGNDTVVYQSGATAFQPAALNAFQVTSSSSTQGYFPSAQSLPPGWKIWEAGQNASSPTSAVLAVQETNFTLAFGVFTANVGSMAPSTPMVALAPAFPFGLVPFDASIDYDPAANLAYVTVEGESPTGFDNSDDRLEVVNLNSGTVTHDYDLGDLGSIADLVIDPVTHVGAITSNPPFCGCPSVVFSPQLLLVNLNNGVISTPLQLPSATTSGGGGIGTGVVAKIAVDPVHHLFAVQNPTPAVDDDDNNPLGEIDTFDENGNLVSHSARLYNLSQWTLGNHWFQLNPGTSPGTQRDGFMFGPNFDQIIPFSY